MGKRENYSAKQTTLNMISQVATFLINMAIGFFLTPYIVKHVGTEANGFVRLSSDFISYATLITSAINSMAGRFIAVSYFKNEEENVLKYYSSVVIANIFLVAILSIPAGIIIGFLPYFIDVSPALVSDVRMLFIYMFIHFFIDIIGSAWRNSAYVMNRLDLVATRQIESLVLKAVFMVLFFVLFLPHIWYVGLVQLICTVYRFFRNFHIHHKLMPEIKVNRKYFDIKKVWELLSSGIWNSISSLGTILMGGLDILIVNLAISDTAMGNVSLAKFIPIYISSIVVTMANVFAPKQTKLFAEGNFAGMSETLSRTSKITAIIASLPVAFMIVYGMNFFNLWVPTEDGRLLWYISIVAVAFYPISLVTAPFSAVVSSANKVKVNSIATLVYSGVSLLAMFIGINLVETEIQKITIVVGSSALFTALQSLTFLIPYCTKVIKAKSGRIYLTVLRSIIAVLLISGVCFGIRYIFPPTGWLKLIVSGAILCIVGVIISGLVILNPSEIKSLLGKFVSKLKRKQKEDK